MTQDPIELLVRFHLQVMNTFGSFNIKLFSELTDYTHQEISFEVMNILSDDGLDQDEKRLCKDIFADLMMIVILENDGNIS